MLEGVKFGDKHTLSDWGLYLKKNTPQIAEAEVQTLFVNVPGRDGMLDLTTALDGDVHYNSRTITVELVCTQPREKWAEIESMISNYMHGKRMRAVFDSDPGHYYIGRWNVEKLVRKESYKATIKITGDCDPYKYALDTLTGDWLWDAFSFEDGVIRDYSNMVVDGSLSVTIPGNRKKVRPVFTASDAMTVTYKDNSWSIPAGTSSIYALALGEGEHTLTITGNGTVTIFYEAGSL